MQLIDQRFPDEKEIGLAVCCDWHVGAGTCNYGGIKKWVEMILKKKWYVLILGDLLENATAGSVGSVFEQELTPQKQIEKVVEILEPIKDYIIGSVQGNHSARTVRVAGLDPDQVVAWELKFPHFGYTATGRIQVGSANWIIYGHHLSGGGATAGGKMNALKKMALTMPMADLYVGAHIHSVAADSDRVRRVALNGGSPRMYWHVRHFSGCGSTLDYTGSYAEAKNLPPAVLGQVVHFLGDRVVQRKDPDSMDRYKKPYQREVHLF